MDPSKVLNEEERKKYSQKRIRLDTQGNSDGGQSSAESEPVNLSNSSPEPSVKMDDSPTALVPPSLPPSPQTPPNLYPLTPPSVYPLTPPSVCPQAVPKVYPPKPPKIYPQTPPQTGYPMAKPMHQTLPQIRSQENVKQAETLANQAESAKSPTSSPKPAELSALVQSAQTTFFQEVYNEFSYDPRLANKVVSGHLNIGSWHGGHSAAFLNIMETVVPFMHFAAMKSPQFRDLCSHDQRLLLKNNAILLREYLTARYLIAETGTEQLVWAFGPSDSIRLGKLDYRCYLDFSHLENLLCMGINHHPCQI